MPADAWCFVYKAKCNRSESRLGVTDLLPRESRAKYKVLNLLIGSSRTSYEVIALGLSNKNTAFGMSGSVSDVHLDCRPTIRIMQLETPLSIGFITRVTNESGVGSEPHTAVSLLVVPPLFFEGIA